MSLYYDYDSYVQNALIGVVKEILKRIRSEGILGNHHFYITFNTNHRDAILPKFLKEKYPQEITIVLQYQFWNLCVLDDHFEVCLSFNGNEEFLSIPFSSISSFIDPYVKFCLQFSVDEKLLNKRESTEERRSDEEEDGQISESSNKNEMENVIVSLDEFRQKKKD